MKYSIRNQAGAFLQKHDLLYLYLRTLRCMMTEGPAEAKKRYDDYVNMCHPFSYRGHLLSREQKRIQREMNNQSDTVISILVPLYNPPRRNLKAVIRSVQKQTYGKWELCLADGSDPEHEDVERYCRGIARRDSRIRYLRMEKDSGIPERRNACLDVASGSYIGLLDEDGLLHSAALYETVRAITGQGADFIYTDEAFFQTKLKDVKRFHYKPDFSPDLLRSFNYLGRFTVFSRKLMEKAGGEFGPDEDQGGDYDLMLRLTEEAGKVVHIAKELYYRREPSESTAPDRAAPRTPDAGRKALAAHLKRTGLEGEVTDSAVPSTFRIKYKISGEPRVSIIIPNKDHAEDLKKCLDSIRQKSTWKNWEAVIVENNSQEEKTFQYYQEAMKSDPRIRVVTWKGEFNFSAICNYGVSFSDGDYVLLLNNDTEVITPEWMEELLMFAQRGNVGAVGCRLCYPDDTVQHAGVTIGIGIAAGHSFRGFPRDADGYGHRLSVASNVSAVTGACLMVPRHVYEEVSGLDESFRVSLNDVDFCLRIRQAGYLVVFTPYAELYHYESKSRGLDEEGKNRERFEAEAAHFREKWKDVMEHGDPYYNPNLTLKREDFSIRDEDERA